MPRLSSASLAYLQPAACQRMLQPPFQAATKACELDEDKLALQAEHGGQLAIFIQGGQEIALEF